MVTIDITSIKRDNALLHSKVEMVGQEIRAKENLNVYIPYRYIESGLAEVMVGVSTLLVLAVFTEDNKTYGLINIPAKGQLEPISIENVFMDKKEYLLLRFIKGSRLLTERSVLKSNSNVFEAVEEFILTKNRPWYLWYSDLVDLFSKVKKFTDSDIANNTTPFEILEALSSKSKDGSLYSRQMGRQLITHDEYEPIGISDVLNVPTNAGVLTGNYLMDGLIEIMGKENLNQTDIESLLLL